METISNSKVVTTDATPTVVTVRKLPANSVFVGVITVVAKTNAIAVRRWTFPRTVKRVGSANAVLVGTAPAILAEQDAALASASAVLGVSGEDLIVTITGLTITMINWSISAELVVVQ